MSMMIQQIRLMTWNINGLRAILQRKRQTLKEFLSELNADIMCFQETKLTRSELDEELARPEGFDAFYSFSRTRSGYSGVVTFVRQDIPTPRAEEGLTGLFKVDDSVDHVGSAHMQLPPKLWNDLESEGRCVITDHDSFVLMNVYCPAVRNSERLEYKLAFHEILRDRIRALQECGKRIILVGDINIAHKEIDHCEPQPSDDGTAFGDHPCRLWMNKLVCNVRTPSLGCLVDSFRHFHPTQEKAFTCWNTVTSARETNYGTRIDYILIDPALMEDFVMDVSHEPGRLGSDHCPVVCAMKLRIAASDDDVKINKAAALCSKYYAEFAGKQQNIKSFLRRDLCSVRAPSTNDAIKTTLSGSRKRGTSSSGQKSIKSFFSSSGLSSSRASSHPTNEGHQKSSFDFELAWAIKASLKRQRTHDQDQQLQWKQVLTGQPPPTPLCHCNQPTVLRAVLKHNDNWGRKFYVCTKPAGPKGDPNARCEYFQWADQRGKKKDTITYQPPDATSNNGQ